jgi:serine/threonine protein kinase
LARYQFNENDDVLGEGSFGKVVKGIEIHTSEIVAVKKISKRGLEQGSLEFLTTEIIIGKILNEEPHAGIVR